LAGKQADEEEQREAQDSLCGEQNRRAAIVSGNEKSATGCCRSVNAAAAAAASRLCRSVSISPEYWQRFTRSRDQQVTFFTSFRGK